jgi:hypothetical protein
LDFAKILLDPGLTLLLDSAILLLMALSLAASYTAISPNLKSSFQASSGTSPYTYSILPGGSASGSINSSTGIYTASNLYGVDTVLVTDSASSQATLDILVGSPVQLVCDIIQTCMGLSQGRVYLYNTKINLPTDAGLYIAVGVQSCRPFGNSNTQYNGISTQAVNMLAVLDINIMSRSLDALNMKEQVLMAFGSNYAESQMELNSFFIAPLSVGFVNLSHIDGSAIPYRFVITSQLQYFSSMSPSVPYMTQFQPSEIVTNP